MRILQCLMLSILLFSCVDNADQLFKVKNLEYQIFKVECDRDTSLISNNGVKIMIEANTFECAESKTVEIAFASIMDKSEMILSNLYSIDDNGQILESAGMFQIRDVTNNAQSFNKSIQLEIPTSTANSRMSKYTSKNDGNLLLWSKSEDSIQMSNVQNIIKGQKIFNAKCMVCHSTNLRNHAVGPALGNVHLHKSGNWLMEFTKNSMKMITDGDSLAMCVAQEWQGLIMTSFPNLSDSEIESIYEFIANESQVQGIAEDETKFIKDCVVNTPQTGMNFNFNDNYKYLVEVNSMDWVNIDNLLPTETKIEPIWVTLDKEYENVSIALVFNNKNIAIPLLKDDKNGREYRLLYSIGKDQINFPIGEPLKIIAYSDAEVFKYKIIDFISKKSNNRIDIILDSTNKDEFLSKIKLL